MRCLALFSRFALALVVGLALILPAAQSRAQSGSWTYIVEPYLWAAGQSGQVGLLPGVPPADLDLSFGDIFEDLDGAFMIVAHARRGAFGISADFQYISTKSEGETPGTAFGGATVDTTTYMASLTADYFFLDTDRLELVGSAGLRYFDVDNTLSLEAGTQPATTASGAQNWVDPMVGLRHTYQLTERVSLFGWAYIGGFGAGSDWMGDIYGGINYSLSDLTRLSLGWRHLKVDYKNGDFVYDVTQSGPVIGLRFTF
ncbi:MAG: hypothetical protein AAGF79_10270 [Pseudomonadota bacterium]